MSDIEKVRQIIKASLDPFFKKVRKYGIKNSIENAFPGLNIEKFVIEKIRKSLRLIKSIRVSKSLGKFNIYYKNGAIRIDCVGTISLFVSQMVISDNKIIKSVEDMFDQVQDTFVRDENFLLDKINKILVKLTQKEFISNADFGEKNLYDLVLCILLNYYNTANVEFPDWLGYAIRNVDEINLAKDFIYLVSDAIVKTLNSLSDNVYLNYDIIFDSRILRFFLNKNTNRGKISDLLKMFKFDFSKIMDDFIKSYVSRAFLKGLGDHLISIINDLTFNTYENENNRCENRFNFTMSLGNGLSSRRFRWFGTSDVDEFLEVSESKSFLNSVMVKATKEKVKISRPTIFDFGTIAEYRVENKNRYSVTLNNFKFDKEYFIRVRRSLGNFESKFTIKSNENCEFVIISDSQGMTKNDYDMFSHIFQRICEKFEPQFVAHLGDFVDDGNNENYWDFLLNCPCWGRYPVFPIAGNHEAKFHPTLDFLGVPNSIVNHFNVNIPEQMIEKGVYYSFEKNNCLFVFLNTNTSGGLGNEQLRWAESIFKNSTAKWKIIFMHKSVYSNGPHNGGEEIENLRKQLNEITLKYDVDLVFGGHDHVYSRSKAMHFGNLTDEDISADGSFINLIGTIFITLGPVGPKNYKIFVNKKANNEILLDLKNPSFANVKITNDELKIEILHFKDDRFNIIDEIKIVKNDILAQKADFIEKEIKNVPVVPWISMQERLRKINEKYNLLSRDDKLRVKSHEKLKELIKYDLSYRKIRTGNISIVFNKEEFLSALRNKNVRTIIVRCDVIKFENKFGMERVLKIDRDLFIKGDAKLKFVSFIVKKGVNFHIGGSIMIDNNRKKFSIYPPICSFILQDNSTLVLLENFWVEQYHTFLKKFIIKGGDNVKIFINSDNLKKIPNNFVNKKTESCIFKYEVNENEV